MHVGDALNAEATEAGEAVRGVDADGVSATDAVALLAARRARGDHRRDPVRFRLIEALARRSATYRGAARRILDARLAQLLAAYDEGFNARDNAADEGTAAAPNRAASRASTADGHADARTNGSTSPGLGELAAQMARPASPGHEDTLNYLRSTWSRLSTERQLTQALATVPENAGPLNSHQLVHRSLALMRELSPAYLHRFMPYVDTLLWLDQAKGGRTLTAADEPRAEGRKKPSRGKAG
ncbi:MAG: DUF2894 domain-containing protein [Variovorax sp.]|nr:MAG: DUF2894 domain-containing protein [Variovorax sp.]